MAAHKHTAPVEAHSSESSPAPEFHKLQSRLLNLVGYFRLVDQRLFDLQGVPEELQPAAVVLHDATEALDQLHNEFDGWHVQGTAGAPAAEGSQAAPSAILAAVEAQRSLLINVASTIRCLKFSEEAGELGGPLELVEMELQRVLGGLEGPQLEMAASAGGES
ncbi:MAG: hypothetical protein WBW93_17860 [Steroidobacteraceae bacterium]